MFERFTKAARAIVLDAVREAECEEAPRVTGEHLLLALLRNYTPAGGILAAAGLTRDVLVDAFATTRRRGGLTDTEAESLRSLGIDVDAVVEHVEREHGPGALAEPPRSSRRGHVPFAGDAKSLLAGALRHAVDRRDRGIGDEHMLLAMTTGGGAVAQVLAAHGLTYPEVRARLAKAS